MREVHLLLADIPLALEFQDQDGASTVASFFGGFLCERDPIVTLKVQWNEPRVVDPSEKSQLSMPQGEISNGTYYTRWDHYRGEFQLNRSAGTCEVAGTFGLHKYLWALMSVLLPQTRGVLLHAASVQGAGHAQVFPAPSGTGKSTLIKNSPHKQVLSDEGTLLRLVDGRLYAYGSPFRSGDDRDFGTTGRNPVEGIYFLRQAPFDRIAKVSKAEALQRLLPEVFLFCHDPHIRVLCFQTVEQIIQSTETYLLDLTNSAHFWGCIDGVRKGEKRA